MNPAFVVSAFASVFALSASLFASSFALNASIFASVACALALTFPSSAVTALRTSAIASLAAARPPRSSRTSSCTVSRLDLMWETSDSIRAILASITYSSSWSWVIRLWASFLLIGPPSCPFHWAEYLRL